MNKRKRWLLPEVVKADVERLYWNKFEHGSASTKRCKKAKFLEDTKQPRVTVIERNAASNIDRHQPDCITVISSHSTMPQRKPRKKWAHVGDLKPRLTPEDGVEVCYEFLSPFPKKAWPQNRQHGRLPKRDYRCEMQGKKSVKKCKGRRNKGYQDLTPNCGSYVVNLTACDKKIMSYKHGNYTTSAYDFPLGAYVNDVLKLRNTDENSRVAFDNVQTIPLPSSTVVYGKGDAIYIENDDPGFSRSDAGGNVNSLAMKETEPMIVDRKIAFSLLADDSVPDNLLQQFGENYIEDNIFPRRFIIKTDMSEISTGVVEEHCMLFEVEDTNFNTVQAKVSVLLPTHDEVSKNLGEILESGLLTLSLTGPLRVKNVVERTTQLIIREVSCMAKNCCLKKRAPSIAKVPVEFIHSVCERKPEIRGARDVVRHSMENSGEEKMNSPPRHLSTNQGKDLCCDICYLKVDAGQQDPDFTSLLQCSHHFCNHCWTMYIVACIGLGQPSITCPYFKCKTVIGEPIVWSRTNSEVYRQYMKLKREVAIDMNQQYRHCPAANCTHVAYIKFSPKNRSLALPVLCNCGQVWCFGCQGDAHWPASCEEAESFRKKCEDHESLKQTYLLPGYISSVQVKRCPFCSQPIEKGRGCQHMSCRCGNSFCWECLCPWENHNWERCGENRKDLEDVELAFDYGSARFKKYSKIAFENFIERTGKRIGVLVRLTERAKQLHGFGELVSFNQETSAKRRLRKYTENNLGSFLEQIFHFKYLAHLVIENTATVLAITKTKNLLKSLDKNIQMLDFIVRRLDEVFTKPEAQSHEDLDNVNLLLLQGKQLIRNIHSYTRARRLNGPA